MMAEMGCGMGLEFPFLLLACDINPETDADEGECDSNGDDGGSGCAHGYSSFRASTTAPRIAMRIRIDVTSKGSSSDVNNMCETSWRLLEAFRSPPTVVVPSAMRLVKNTHDSRPRTPSAPGIPAI